jgi:allantoinase
MENQRYSYWPQPQRPRLSYPNGARVALWLIPNIEHFPFDWPWHPDRRGGLVPDVLSYSARDYGNRVGVWRLMDILGQFNIRATVALNADICRYEPQIVEAGVERKWEWMGHGRTNSQQLSGLDVDAERETIRSVLDTIAAASGQPVRGWLGPGLVETMNTPDLLAELGITYVADWPADDQPFPMRVKQGRLIAMPYLHINDILAYTQRGWTGEQFYQSICDQFDVFYDEGARNARVMSISLHPDLSGQPSRAKWLTRSLEYITAHDEVWLATGGEIADWYYQHYYDQALELAPFPK